MYGSGDHTVERTVISNKIQQCLMVMVPMKYGKWHGIMASGSKIWDIK